MTNQHQMLIDSLKKQIAQTEVQMDSAEKLTDIMEKAGKDTTKMRIDIQHMRDELSRWKDALETT